MLHKPFSNNNNVKVLYRYTSPMGSQEYELKLDLKEYRIVKETPKGFWIWTGWGIYENYLPNNYESAEMQEHTKRELKSGLKWVSNDGRKRFAYPTKAEAQFNFKCRKERQIKFLKSNLAVAENALRAVNLLMHPNIEDVKKA